MFYIPVISRLNWEDYKRLTFAILILLVESVLRLIALFTPGPIHQIFNINIVPSILRLRSGNIKSDLEEEQENDPWLKIRNTEQFCRHHGYGCESHLVLTGDGYILQMHRIVSKRVKEGKEERGPPILVLHGCMMSSEIWICRRKSRDNLVLYLADLGYDIWLANRRGTPYSQKHVSKKPYSPDFWDFSIDECIIHDVPAQVEYILNTTKHAKINLMGFSQGSAELLGAISFNRKLRKYTNCMVGLSATAKPPAPKNRLIQSMVHWTPPLVFLLFGRKVMLKSVWFWQSVLSAKTMVWLMDWSMRLLFGWRNEGLPREEKPILYRHLYSSTSVKQIAHWFQIMRSERFQMFDDDPALAHSMAPEYPIANIRIPMMLFLGGRDCLADKEYLKQKIGDKSAEYHEINEYEHMDSIWASDAPNKVFPLIASFLKKHNNSPQQPQLAKNTITRSASISLLISK